MKKLFPLSSTLANPPSEGLIFFFLNTFSNHIKKQRSVAPPSQHEHFQKYPRLVFLGASIETLSVNIPGRGRAPTGARL